MIYLTIFSLLLALLMYKRYFPVLGVPTINLNNLKSENVKLLDLRDFNQSYKDQIDGSVNIPIAYLNRNIDEIPNVELYVIASSALEKNVGIRWLRKKGFHVVGYSIYADNNSFKLTNYC